MHIAGDVRHHQGVAKHRATTFDATRLEAARHAKGYTQAQLAIRVGLSISTISSYVLGKTTPPAPTLLKLADVLDVETTDLAPLSADPPLRELIWHAGLLVEDVAALIGRSQLHAGSIIRGDFPVPEPEALADALNITSEQLDAAWHAARRERLED